MQAYLTSPHGQQCIETTPCSRDTGSVGFVVAQIQVRGKEQDRRKRHGEKLERTRMLGCDQGGQECWWYRVLCKGTVRLAILYRNIKVKMKHVSNEMNQEVTCERTSPIPQRLEHRLLRLFSHRDTRISSQRSRRSLWLCERIRCWKNSRWTVHGLRLGEVE